MSGHQSPDPRSWPSCVVPFVDQGKTHTGRQAITKYARAMKDVYFMLFPNSCDNVRILRNKDFCKQLVQGENGVILDFGVSSFCAFN